MVIGSLYGGGTWEEQTCFPWPKAIRDSARRPVQKEDLVLLQEVPREREGWSYSELAGRRVVAHRTTSQWRGTGIWYDPRVWCVLRKVPTEKGSWFKVRHLERRVELWIGTMHLTPGAPVAQFEP